MDLKVFPAHELTAVLRACARSPFLFDVPRVLTALQRGACCKVDLSAGYDVSAHKHRPLDEVREAFGVPALPALAKAS